MKIIKCDFQVIKKYVINCIIIYKITTYFRSWFSNYTQSFLKNSIDINRDIGKCCSPGNYQFPATIIPKINNILFQISKFPLRSLTKTIVPFKRLASIFPSIAAAGCTADTTGGGWGTVFDASGGGVLPFWGFADSASATRRWISALRTRRKP